MVKQKQKQKQTQNVIVNVNAPKGRKSRKPRPPPRPVAPSFPIGPRSDPFIPREYKPPTLTDLLSALQFAKQPVSQSIEKEPAKQPSVFGTEPNPKALQSVVPPKTKAPTLERKRPTENPFKFVDASPTLSIEPSESSRENFGKREQTEFAKSLIPETETFVSPSEYTGTQPLFINEFASPFFSFLPVKDYGYVIPETTTLLEQPVTGIAEEGPSPEIQMDEPLPPQKKIESSSLGDQTPVPSFFDIEESETDMERILKDVKDIQGRDPESDIPFIPRIG